MTDAFDGKELIKKFYKFFENYKKQEIKNIISIGQSYLPISFQEISEYDFELCEEILANPQEIITIMEETLKQFAEIDEPEKNIKIRFTSLPDNEKLLIRDIRSEHLGKLVLIEGLVRRKTDVRPRLKYLEYLCTNPSCNFSEDKIRVPQFEDKARILKNCPKCRSSVEVLNKILLDSQSLILEEIPEHLQNSGEQPKRINVLLQEDLVSPFKDSKTNPGTRVFVIGLVKEVPLTTKTGADSVNYDLIIEANHIDLTDEDYSEIIISKEEEEEIKQLSQKEDVYDILVKNTAPAIYGHQKIKEAMLLQLFGGNNLSLGSGIKKRGDIHILLLGDPGAAKSQLLKSSVKIAPKSMFVSGKSATAAGLCVSPKSLVITENSQMYKIKDLVESRFNGDEKLYSKGIWKKEGIDDIKIQSMDENLHMHSKNPYAIWKLESPQKIYRVTLKSGKEIELTENTALYCMHDGLCEWVKSKDIKQNMYIATPKKLLSINKNHDILSLINYNPTIKEFKSELKHIIKQLKIKYGSSSTEIMQKFCIDEKNICIYSNNDTQISETKDDLIKLSSLLDNYSFKNDYFSLSLDDGYKQIIPSVLNKDILYLTGLVAGIGRIKTTENEISIIMPKIKKSIVNDFKKIVYKNFKLKCEDFLDSNLQLIKVDSKILGQILFSFGICTDLESKENFCDLSNQLLGLDNNLLSNYIAGIYDSTGYINVLKNSEKLNIALEISVKSKTFAKKIQLALLRFEIFSIIKEETDTINSAKEEKYIISISDTDNIKRFLENIELKNTNLRNDVEKISQLAIKNNDYDVLSGLALRLKEIMIRNNILVSDIDFYENMTRKDILDIIKKADHLESEDINQILTIINSDMFFEPIKSIEHIDSKDEYVYDLTVEKSHNFIVDGILVHNTATVLRDELTKGWALEAGAMVLASGGLCAIDEMDKMSDEDTSAMHEALEQQTISIAKANIRATLRCNTTVLGAANPKYGRFDPYTNIMKQIDFPPALVSRFDLIFIVRDIPDKKKDRLIAGHILEIHQDVSRAKTEISEDFLKKYIAYAKKNIHPELTDQAIEKLRDFYIAIRNASGEEEEAGMKAVPITARQLEAIVRLAEAYAKIKLDNKVKLEYAQRAIDLMMYCLEKIGLDPKTGNLDIDTITSGISQSSRNEYKIIQNIINDLEVDNADISYEKILLMAVKNSISETDVKTILDKLIKEGSIFEPRKGVYKKLS